VDKLCAQLNGRGVANLEDALVNLELRPVHEALRLQLDSAVVRLFADWQNIRALLPAGRWPKTRRLSLNAASFLNWPGGAARHSCARRRKRTSRVRSGEGRRCWRHSDESGIAGTGFPRAASRGHADSSGRGAFSNTMDGGRTASAAQSEPAVHATAMWGRCWRGARWNCWPSRSTRKILRAWRWICSIAAPA